MPRLHVTLTKIIDWSYPIVGQFEFTDALGEIVIVHEKLPVMGVEYNGKEPNIPLRAQLECSVEATADGIVDVDLNEPHGIADIRAEPGFGLRLSFSLTPREP